MQLTPRAVLTQFSHLLQTTLLPAVSDEIGTLTPQLESLVSVLALVPLGKIVESNRHQVGHPSCERQNLASAFIAKAVLNLVHTGQLIDRLKSRCAAATDLRLALPIRHSSRVQLFACI